MKSHDIQDGIHELLKLYGESDPIQPAQQATTDNQLKSLALTFEGEFKESPTGTVLDIGCGHGVLLEKLAGSHSFIENTGWNYLGADYEPYHEEVLLLATSHRLHRRCDVISLDSLYDSWLGTVNVARPLSVVIRNVLHELDISKTAKLLSLLSQNLGQDDTLYIQDLLVFPQAERGNVCWEVTSLVQALNAAGFDGTIVAEPSKSGAQWFSAVFKKTAEKKSITIEEATEIVGNARLHQLESWRRDQEFILQHKDTRLPRIASLDFDLQLAALYQQLDNCGLLSGENRSRKIHINPSSVVELALSSYDPAILDRDHLQLRRIDNFRDRATSQDALEIYLNSSDSIAVIEGGTSCGKTALVAQVLYRRAHGRSIIPIDCDKVIDFWPILEQYLLSIGAKSSFEILTSQKELAFEDIENDISSLVDKISNRTIVVFDHFEQLLDPNGQVMDADMRRLISILTSAKDAKVIITTRKEVMLGFLPGTASVAKEQPPVGRFPNGPHIENLLDDYIDRASIGLEHYPAELLEAIDKFPYLATLAGKLISKEGISALDDPELFKVIKLYLYDEIVNRIASQEARSALKLAAMLRTPAPRYLFDKIIGPQATNAAIETGLLYSIPDRYRDDLLTCASVLRSNEEDFDYVNNDDDDKEHVQSQEDIHTRIAKCFLDISNSSEGDPRWIREAHYHALTSGNEIDVAIFGAMYKAELFWAAKTWFRKFRNYKYALELLLSIESMGFHTYESRKLVAACHIRLGHRDKGEVLYRELISEYPNQEGLKTSFIDSLIKIKEFGDALDLLGEFGLTLRSTNPWIAGQYGRAYQGLREYTKAAEAFCEQLRKTKYPEAVNYTHLVQAYFMAGDKDKAEATLKDGLHAYPDDPALNTLNCANLLRSNSKEDWKAAELRLSELADRHPRNGYILQKLITASALHGNLREVLQRLDSIGWQVDPTYMKQPIEIAILLAQKNYSNALKTLNGSSFDEVNHQAIMRKIYLSWASSESNQDKRKKIAADSTAIRVPEHLENNVPIMTMYAQLCFIAGDMDAYNKTIDKIRTLNSNAADRIIESQSLYVESNDIDIMYS